MPALIDVHPLADLMPAMSDAEFAELRASIEASGLRVPIALHPDGRILDGRHRAKACASLGIIPKAETFDGTERECLQFVLDLNLKRRHLDESQRAMIAAELANVKRADTLRQGSRSANLQIGAVSQSEAASLFNVSPRSVASAKAVLASAIPEIREAVRQGHMPVSKAEMVAKLPEPRQQQVAAEMHNGKSVLTTVLAATRAERAAVIERDSLCVPLSLLGRRFPVLYGDPPWEFQAWSAGGQQKSAEMHYPTMPVEQIAAIPVPEIAADDAVLFMWAVPALFPQALQLIELWGFTFKTFAIWEKPHIACGHWFRGKFEPLIVATRGEFPPPPHLRDNVFTGAAIREHSRKPDEVRNWIAEAYPAAGKIELFCRGEPAPGWTGWGFEARAAAA